VLLEPDLICLGDNAVLIQIYSCTPKTNSILGHQNPIKTVLVSTGYGTGDSKLRYGISLRPDRNQQAKYILFAVQEFGIPE
jgi:hypothetical protein